MCLHQAYNDAATPTTTAILRSNNTSLVNCCSQESWQSYGKVLAITDNHVLVVMSLISLYIQGCQAGESAKRLVLKRETRIHSLLDYIELLFQQAVYRSKLRLF